MDGGICVNGWLRREGFLVLKGTPDSPRTLTPDLVGWSRTTAWGEGGYYCRLFLNVAGREPHGTVASSDYDRVRDELKAKREARRRARTADRNGRAQTRGSVPGAKRDRT
jgi:predicted AlkP superfamily phosphohydrolase/phosphomutase